jgi:hypothetical protein
VIKKLHIFIIFCLISLGGFAQSGGKTLHVNAYGIQMTFLKERTKIKSNQLASNVLRIKNMTRKKMSLKLQISPPAGWKLFAQTIQDIELKPGDSLFVPVRVHPAVNLTGNTNYVVNAFISTESFTVTNAMWYVVVEKRSEWHAYTNSNKVYFRNETDTASFQLIISNTGNSDEYLQVRVMPEKEIYLLDRDGNDVTQITRSVLVAAGQDTTLRFSARLHRGEMLPEGPTELNKYQNKRYRAKIRVLNEKSGKGGNKSWSGTIDFLQLNNTTKIKETKRNALPLTVEANFYDLMSNRTYAALYLYGHRNFTKYNGMLNYYFQANFIQNQMDLNSFMGNYQYVGYFNKRFSVELGDIGANRSGSMLSGKGVKASVNVRNNNIGALYVKRPKLWEKADSWGYGFFHRYQNNKIFWDNYYQRFDNTLSKVRGDLITTNLNYRLTRNHSFRLGGGYSSEWHYWTPGAEKTVTGFNLRAGYTGNFNKINVNMNGQYSTENYSPMRGVLSVSPAVRYTFNKNYTLELSGYFFDFEPIIYAQGVIQRDDIYNIQTNYNAKLFYTNKKSLFIFQPTYYTIESNMVDANTGGMIMEYRLRSTGNFKFYTNLFMGYTAFPQRPDLGNIFVSYVRASIRYKFLQSNIRYYYGPYYQIEQMMYLENEINPQKLYANIYYDWWFLHNKMKLNINLNYYFTTINSRHQLNTRPELFYYANSGFRFSFYARYILYGEGEHIRELPAGPGGQPREEVVEASVINQFEIGAGVKFNVNIPIGVTGNCKVKVVAFRDMNGNGKKDLNEQGIGDMLIHFSKKDATGQEYYANPNSPNGQQEVFDLVTDKKGEVEYLNVPRGEYVITARPLSSMGGWFDGKTFYRNIDHDKTVYIPLSKGARISGGILFERARFGSDKMPELSGIRVTAMNDDDGRTFTTLTDERGNFALYVPNGNYRIIINEAAVGNRFEFLQNNIPVNINKEFEDYNVSFYLIEKQRNMRLSGGDISYLPIRRNQKAAEKAKPAEQYAQLQDSNYVPVVEPDEQGKVWVVQLYSAEGPRRHKTDFDTLAGVTNVRCIVGPNGKYLYISDSFSKKGPAKKLAKTLQKYGYPEAAPKSMVFGNTVSEKNTGSVNIAPFDAAAEGEAYRIEIKTSPAKLDGAFFESFIPGVTQVYEVQFEGLYHYAIGKFDTQEEAKSRLDELKKQYPGLKMIVRQYRLNE